MSNLSQGRFNLKFLFLAALAGASGQRLARPAPRRYGGRFGPYKPHQSMRECARRRGGREWANFKAIDRARRGLPAYEADQLVRDSHHVA